MFAAGYVSKRVSVASSVIFNRFNGKAVGKSCFEIRQTGANHHSASCSVYLQDGVPFFNRCSITRSASSR